MNADVHVLLVSEQAAPNLLPALDPALKPAEAVLVVTGKMQSRAPDLEAVLTEAGVRTTRVALADEHDFAKLQEALLDLATERSAQRIALNVTGGTKLMALAAQSVATTAGWQVFYVDVDTDEAIWFGMEARRQPLTEQLRLRHYLRGYGFTLEEAIERPQPNQRHNDLLRTLVGQVGSLEKPLAHLNWLAQQAEEGGRLGIELSSEQMDSRGLEALLRNFQDAYVLTTQGKMLKFASESERSFAKGGWLETHVFRTVNDLTGDLGLRDKAANLVVVDRNGVKNELDVAFMARNRLFVIECKTARMEPEVPKANDTLFKLSEICRRVGGLGTRGMLASYRRLGEAERRLAGCAGSRGGLRSRADMSRGPDQEMGEGVGQHHDRITTNACRGLLKSTAWVCRTVAARCHASPGSVPRSALGRAACGRRGRGDEKEAFRPRWHGQA